MGNGDINVFMPGAIDVIAQTKAVLFRPSTSTDTIRVGDLVCYNSDLAADYKERTTNPNSSGATYAEGSQNYTARLTVVEKPATANLRFFAGVVAKLGPLAGKDGDLIEVFVPNGAVVPVMCDQYCTVDRTIVCVRNGAYEGSYPSAGTSIPIGIALETKDRSSTDGLVWVKVDPNMFISQSNLTNSLIIDDEAGSAGETVNNINLYFAGTGGPKRGLYAVGEIAGAGHSLYGMWKFRTYLDAAASSTIHGLCANLHIKDSGTLTRTSGTVNSALYVTVETEVTTTAPTLSGGDLCGISLEYYVDESTAAPANAYALYVHAGTYNWDGLLWIRNAGDCGDAAMTGDHAFDAADKCIPVLIGNYTGGTTYYIPLMNNKGD